MDLSVYTKETVSQPEGDINVLVANVIDLKPLFEDDDDTELSGATIITDEDEAEQMVALATIFQRGLDPVEVDDGIQWGELLRNEITVFQLITEINQEIAEVSSTARVSFSTVTDAEGVERLVYTISAV